MPLTTVLAISDRPCARAALSTLPKLAATADGELVVLGVVQPFRTIYAHKHPWIGRQIRNLLWQTNTAQVAEMQQLVRETSTSFESLGWHVRGEVREGHIADEILSCCQATCPQLLVVGSCLRRAMPSWPSRHGWNRVVNEAPCPVLMLKHGESANSIGPTNGHAAEHAEELQTAMYDRDVSHAVLR